MAEILKRGASLIGGCCGTTPAHIRAMVEATKDQRDITDRPGKEFKNLDNRVLLWASCGTWRETDDHRRENNANR